MPIIRKKLIPDEVYPSNLRYNEGTDTVQTNVNGDWVDSPENDPRHQTTFPPHITADTACDAAQSVADALTGQIQGITDAIDNTATLFTIAGIILSIFTFGTFGVFISIALTAADAMVGYGSAAIEAALTEPVWEQLACILYCAMDGNGRLTESGLAEVQAQVSSEIGGLAATIINQMLSLAGEGGVNNLGAIGTSTGDCSGCGCVDEWCYDFDFTISDWSAFVTVTLGTWVGGTGWVGVAYGTGGGISGMEFNFDVSQLRGMSMLHSASGYGGYQKLAVWQNLPAAGVNHGLVSDPETMNGVNIYSQYDSFDIENLANRVTMYVDGAGSSNATIHHVTFWGTGVNPFGENNCTPP
jgi:hypothetical protein